MCFEREKCSAVFTPFSLHSGLFKNLKNILYGERHRNDNWEQYISPKLSLKTSEEGRKRLADTSTHLWQDSSLLP